MNAEQAYYHMFNRLTDLCELLETLQETEHLNIPLFIKEVQSECEEIFIGK